MEGPSPKEEEIGEDSPLKEGEDIDGGGPSSKKRKNIGGGSSE